MPTKYKDYPIYTYDEPATYSDFSGGINTDPSNEHLLENELRDCLNMHYSSGALVKRQGASILSTIKCEEDLFNIQGVFLFTYKITYLIVVADGKIYYGYYTEKGTIQLKRLLIAVTANISSNKYDPLDVSAGLENLDIPKENTQHDGYTISNYKSISNKIYDISVAKDYVYDFKENDTIDINTILKIGDEYFLTQSEILKTVIKPTNHEYWMNLTTYNSYYSEEIKREEDPISVYYATSLDTIANKLTLNTSDPNNPYWIPSDNYKDYTPWSDRNEKYTRGECYKFIEDDILTIYPSDYFVCTASHSSSSYQQFLPSLIKLYLTKELILQNYLPVEAATFDNKMYIATGTRFIELKIHDNNLTANVVEPYKINSSEFTYIGDNYLSPYPELCRTTTYNQAITSISTVLSIEQQTGNYLLQPIMTFAGNETENDYYFKWEKCVDGVWVTIVSYKDNIFKDSNGDEIKLNYYTLQVTDADKYQYRVSFAKAFETPVDMIESWDFYHGTYEEGDIVSAITFNGSEEVTKTYKCVTSHDPAKYLWEGIEYFKTQEESIEYPHTKDKDGKLTALFYVERVKKKDDNTYVFKGTTPLFSSRTTSLTDTRIIKLDPETLKELGDMEVRDYSQQAITLWQQITLEEEILKYSEDTKETTKDKDFTVDKVTGEYFGQATSVIAKDLQVDDTFLTIHSCRKITSDGNKLLLYGDKFNSGSWFKTIINNPQYITLRGGLSFKTNKNETLLKVIPFQGNLIAFANAETVGGSIHLITGNGDDYDANDGYYSPYRRMTINNSISCDNEATIQVCENILVFKYFDTLYYITASELSNEVITLYSCNDRIKHDSNFVQIPWSDNSCISEVTDDYYALIWKEKYSIQDGDLILERPALKIKMYYKLGFQHTNKYIFPWLRDESVYFNTDHILYAKGKPIYLYNNTLLSFHTNEYTDLGTNYTCSIHFRGEELNYPKIVKLIHSVLIYYHRNQYSNIDFDIKVCNEAGHILLDNKTNKISLQDIRALKAGDTFNGDKIRLDSTILDSKVFNAQYLFPCLLADTIITATNDKEFSVSSITYTYTTSEVPETTPYDLYSNIIRIKEVK